MAGKFEEKKQRNADKSGSRAADLSQGRTAVEKIGLPVHFKPSDACSKFK